MRIISSAELRANQKKYFDLAETEPVFVTRRAGKPVVIKTAIDEDFITPEELACIQRSLDNYRNGKTFTMLPDETLDEFLKRVTPCIE